MSEEIIQGSQAWLEMRAGKFTASRFVDLVARNKKTGEKLKSFKDYVWSVLVERMTGLPQEGANSYSMAWGHDVEPYAREAYELSTGLFVAETSFIQHPKYEFAGASPDGLIDDDGGLELKCPKDSSIHLERFISGVPPEYVPQVQGCMWVTGRQWWDFASYDPRMPTDLRLLVIRINRDEELIKLIESSVLEAENEVQNLLTILQRKAA